MQHILIIDFSLICPILSCYDNIILTDKMKEEQFFNSSCTHALGCDLSTYRLVTKFLLTVFHSLPKEKIKFFKDGRNIAYDNPVQITNLSHYSYLEAPMEWNCPQLQQYYWIHNTNSLPLPSVVPINTIHKTIFDFNWEIFPLPDEVCLVFSHDLIPPMSRNLFDLWGVLYSTVYHATPTFMDCDLTLYV